MNTKQSFASLLTSIRDEGNLNPLKDLGGGSTGGEGAPSRDHSGAGDVELLALAGHVNWANIAAIIKGEKPRRSF